MKIATNIFACNQLSLITDEIHVTRKTLINSYYIGQAYYKLYLTVEKNGDIIAIIV